mmetsp:Transcript_20606/g.31750  ORF Transcript_20606/g.31750 Transcript_20606/m.31750 type:complete len:152 (+) Transcript_20606:1947-2402(+)
MHRSQTSLPRQSPLIFNNRLRIAPSSSKFPLYLFVSKYTHSNTESKCSDCLAHSNTVTQKAVASLGVDISASSGRMQKDQTVSSSKLEETAERNWVDNDNGIPIDRKDEPVSNDSSIFADLSDASAPDIAVMSLEWVLLLSPLLVAKLRYR